MTSYQGGKKRIGKSIHSVLTLVEQDIEKDRLLPYFEPFIGMGGVMVHFAAQDNGRELYASDANKDIILLWKAVQKDWKPPLKCTKKEYLELKDAPSSAKRGFIGIVASYGTIFYGGYRLDYNKTKDYLKEGYNGLMKAKPFMKRVDFMKPSSYIEWEPKGYLIYCDPPYLNNTLKTRYFQKFDHELFWETMRKWSKNNIIVVSESVAPKDFKQIWCKKSNCATRDRNKVYKDCLFLHETLYKKLSLKTLREIKQIK